MTDPSAWRTTTYDAGTRRWVENLSATGRRQATSVAASKLRQWVNGTNEERPSRGELKAWVLLVLDERRGLHNRVEALTTDRDGWKADAAALGAERSAHHSMIARAVGAEQERDALRAENDAVRAQRDEALEDAARARDMAERGLALVVEHEDDRKEVDLLRFKVEGLEQTVAHVCRARDEALEVGVAWRHRFETVERELDVIQAQRDNAREEERTAREASTRYAEEADELRDDLAAERAAHDADVAELGDHRDTLKGMLRQAQCERDRLRGELQERVKFSAGAGRAECSHTPGGGAK